MERKLAAIFSADVVGYSRLMGDDEEATIRTLTAYREVISSLIRHHRGRVVDAPGDNLLAEFASVVDALRCAVEIQHALKEKNAQLPENRQMHFRIGINLGDVIVEGERLYGDGVNIAARLESLAIPGAICISGTVYDQVETKLALTYDYQSEQTVKNIAKPVRTYRVVMDETAAALVEQAMLRLPLPVRPSVAKDDRRGLPTRGALLLASLGLLVGTVVAMQYLSLPTPNTQLPIPNPQATPVVLPLPEKPSLVVLPFVNMSNDPEQGYFSDGLTDVLTGDLSRISSLFVIARNSAFTYKGKAVNMQDIRKELGVRYVLEGSVQKAGEQVRIVTQLIDTTTGSHLWSERYDRPLKDLFALQDEIVQKIVTTLKLQLSLEEQGYIVRKRTDNLAAYDAFLRGKESFSRLTKEGVSQAQTMYEQAIALDPHYTEAYAWLGLTHYHEQLWRWSADPQQSLEQALALARQAIGLDDTLPDAHSLLAKVYAVQRQYDQAIAEGERAVALDPSNAESYAGQAEVLNFAGRPEHALHAVAQAMRLNPRYPPWYLFEVGWAHQLTGRYAEAIATQQEVLRRSPHFLSGHLSLAYSYLLQWVSQQSPDGQTLEPAVAAIQRALALNDSWSLNHITLGHISLHQQRYDDARGAMERAIALDPNEAWGYAALAEVLSRMGRREEALVAADKALQRKPVIEAIHLLNLGIAYALIGRTEEAVTPLKQYLTRYPNMLSAHLTLIAVHSELEQTAVAQKEAAEVLQLNPNFSLEVHKQRMPIKDPAVLEQHIAALRKAGLK
jgi:adenylate cyclase